MEDITNRFGFSGYVDSRIGGRSENQDSYGFADTPLGLLVVVCDGMGGGPAGKTASELATATIVEVVRSCKPQDNPEKVLTKAVESANSALIGAVSANPSLRGMGTTCVALLLNRKHAYIAHVGDSRCYQLRDGKVAFRTADHSYVAEMVRKCELTEEQARLSNHSNVITRAIGIRPTVEAEIDKVGVKAGDRFALMSDGIWGTMQEVHLVGSLCSDEELPLVVGELADRVDAMGHNNGGKHDNMTLAVVDFPAAAKQTAAKVLPTSPSDTLTEAESSGHSARKPRPLWPLLALLIFSMGVNAFFLLRPSSENKSNAVQTQDTIKDLHKTIDRLKQEIKDLNSQNEELRESLSKSEPKYSSSNVSEVSEEMGNMLSSLDGSKNGDKVQYNSKGKLLQNAIKILMQIDTLEQMGKISLDKKKIRRDKRKELDKVCSNLVNAANYSSDKREKKTLLSISENIKAAKRITDIDIDGKTTGEAHDSIQGYIYKIKTLMKE